MTIPSQLAWITDKIWVGQAFITVLVTLIAHYIETRVYRRIYPRLSRSKVVWDDALAFSVHKPLGFLIWIIGLSLALDIVSLHAKDIFTFSLVEPVRNFALLVVIIWFLVRFVSAVEKTILKRKKREPKGLDLTTTHALCQLLRTSVIVTGALVALQLFGVPLSGVWAFGGFGGLAIGFAAKDLLGNFFGGLMIYLDRPFAVGEWIRSPEKDIEGTVEYIGWRLTRIRTFDKRALFVPNGLFSTISLENPSRMSHRRIKTVINLRYDDAEKVSVILSEIEAMLRAHPDIDAEETLMVNLVECAAWSLNFMIYAFTKSTKWVEFQKIQQDIFLRVLQIVAAHKAECAFPTSTVHITEGVAMYQVKGS